MTATTDFQKQLRLLWEVQKIDLQSHPSKEDRGTAVELKATFISQISPTLMRQYERIRIARGGIGLSSPSGSRCSACNMTIPFQLYNEIMKQTSLYPCPSCLRLLNPQTIPTTGLETS